MVLAGAVAGVSPVDPRAPWRCIRGVSIESGESGARPSSWSALALGLIAGGMAGAARALPWLAERSALGEMLGVDFQAVGPLVAINRGTAEAAHLDSRLPHPVSRGGRPER